MRKGCTLMLVSVVIASLASPARAQETEARAAVLEGIDHSLKQIVELLKVQVGNQRADLALQRLDIARRELVAREQELQSATENRDQYVQQRDMVQARIDSFGPGSAEAAQMSEEELDFMTRQMDLELESVKQAIWRTDQRIIDLQNAIRRVREDLDAWEAIVADSFIDD